MGVAMLDLTPEDIQKISGYLKQNKPLPNEYRFKLFENPLKAELIWPGKSLEICKAELPFQVIEHIDAPRLNKPEYKSYDNAWSNKLIWGDNKLIMSSLRSDKLRKEIGQAGGIEIGDGESFTKEPSVVEEIAYRDTWGKGVDSYLAMIYERLRLMHSLLAEDGSIYVHCDWRLDSQIRRIMDEIFGNFFRREIIWDRGNPSGGKAAANNYIHTSDIILYYTKSDSYIFNKPYKEYGSEYISSRFTHDDQDGKGLYRLQGVGAKVRKQYLSESKGKALTNVWTLPDINVMANERTLYPTQKPESLLERILQASSNPGDIVADFFCGSGTTLAVAEKLGRRWIGSDLSRFAIHTSRKRLIQIQKELNEEKKEYFPFDLLNLGHYERQYYIGIDQTLAKKERERQAKLKENEFYNLIHRAYKSEPMHQMPPFHGTKNNAAVYIGSIDAPVTESDIEDAVKAAKKQKFKQVDVLGFEFEMGLNNTVQDKAKKHGIELSLRYIPREVFDKRAVDKGQVLFYDVAYLEVNAIINKKIAKVKLTDFGVFYRQENQNDIIKNIKPGGSKVTIQQGLVIKLHKDRQGKIEKQVLTKEWSDWIDYWSVDFDYESLQDTKSGSNIFENQWQTFRTKKNRKLELESVSFTYPKAGNYKIAVKAVDIFGHDTTEVVDVRIG